MNTELTREQKRIRIAEADGWKQVEQSDGDYINGPSPMYPWTNGKDWSNESGEDLPDYFNDLNACHSLLKTMTRDQCNDFNRLLIELRSDITLKNDGSSPQSLRWTWGQPSEVMAECFGRVLKLW